MKIFLGNPPWREGDNYGVRAGSRWPHFHKLAPGQKIPAYMPFPFYLAYAAAVLENERHSVKLIDAIALGLAAAEFLHEITGFEPELIVLEVATPSIQQDLALARTIKINHPQSLIVFCGPHALMSEPEFLRDNPQVDLVAYGEYEYTLRDLASNPENLAVIAGLVYRDGEAVKVNPPRPLIANLDELPLPARHHLPMYNYCDAPAGLPLPSVVVWASRGCPFQCIFCVWPQLMYGGGSYRTRDVVQVVDELAYLVKEYGFKSVNFDDDTFNLGQQRMLDFANEMKRRNLNIPWAIMARADTMNKEILLALKEAGLYSLKYGVESGCQELVNNAGKKLDLAKVKEIVKLTQEIGIKVHLTFSFGLPGETWETVKKTIAFAKELAPFSAQFSIVTPYPGSKYYDELATKGQLLTKDWSKYVGSSDAVFFTEKMSAPDLQTAQRLAVAEWRDFVTKRKLQEGFDSNALAKLPDLIVQQVIVLRTSPLPHLYAALTVLKNKYPQARITVVAQEEVFADLIETREIDRLITYKEGFLKWENLEESMRQFLTKEPADLILCLYGTSPRVTYGDVEDILKRSKAPLKGGLTLTGDFIAL